MLFVIEVIIIRATVKTKLYQGVFSAIICALSFIVGLLVVLFIVPDFNQGAEQRLVVFTHHKVLMQFWYFMVYVVFGISLLFLSRSLLYIQNKEHSLAEQFTMLVSYMWASYILACGVIAILSIEFLFTVNDGVRNISETWQQIYTIQMGLGEGVEWVGSIWVFCINFCLNYRSRFPKNLIYFGYFIAFIGMFTLYPPLAEIGAMFGLLQIIWFLIVSAFLFKECGNMASK